MKEICNFFIYIVWRCCKCFPCIKFYNAQHFKELGGVKGLTVSKGNIETVQTSGTSYISYQDKGIIILQSSSNANISIYAVGIQSTEAGIQTVFKGSGIFTLESESGGFFKVGLEVTNRRISIRNSYTGPLAFCYHYISFTV